ncbi:MAG: GNAT family N-acetyltransferase [Bifidobacterium psychraerophilum]|uniref:GNAT family N-acetyltransferase n=1 Tax=Bifidobacterium psychraerophilum TaxID=218140 RepID=UPI0039ED2E73
MSVCLRPSNTSDLQYLAPIEEQADVLFLELFHPEHWDSAPTGADRLAQGGFIIVAEQQSGCLVGFVHVLEHSGIAHLEQLSVLPDFGRRGIGGRLVGAAKRAAKDRGYRELTLRTYADVPWNAQFYRGLGFKEEQPGTEFHRNLAAVEKRMGLEEFGRRVQMHVILHP